MVTQIDYFFITGLSPPQKPFFNFSFRAYSNRHVMSVMFIEVVVPLNVGTWRQ